MLTRTWRAALLTAAAASVLALTGCTTTVPGTPTAAPTTSATPAPTRAPAPTQAPAAPSGGVQIGGTADRAMIAANRGRTGTQLPDMQLVSLAIAACTVLEQYPTQGGLIGVVAGVQQQTGWSLEDSGFFVGTAIGARCPQFAYLGGR